MATFLRTKIPSISAATRVTVHHRRPRNRICLPTDQRPTTPTPSHVETLRADAVPKRKGAVGRDAGLEPRAMFVLGLIDGFTPVDDVIAASGFAENEAQKMLSDLVVRGLVMVA